MKPHLRVIYSVKYSDLIMIIQAVQEIWGPKFFTSDLVATSTRRSSKPTQFVFRLNYITAKLCWNSLHWVLRYHANYANRMHARSDARTHGQTTRKPNASVTPVGGGGIKSLRHFLRLLWPLDHRLIDSGFLPPVRSAPDNNSFHKWLTWINGPEVVALFERLAISTRSDSGVARSRRSSWTTTTLLSRIKQRNWSWCWAIKSKVECNQCSYTTAGCESSLLMMKIQYCRKHCKVNNNKKAQLSLTNPRDACEKFARFT